MYDLAIVSYILALGHFASEAVVYGTAGLQGLAGPLIVACTSTHPFGPLSGFLGAVLTARLASRQQRPCTG